jgi:hypothetical protein
VQRSRRVGGRLVRAEFGQILRLRSRRLVGPGGPNLPSIPAARLVRRTAFVLLLVGVLVGAQARAAVAQPAPDPHPSTTKSPKAPAPDPAPDAAPTRTAPTRTAPARVAPDPSSSTPSSSVEASAPAQTPAPTTTSVFTPPRTTTPKTPRSTAEQKTRATRPGRQPKTVAAAGKQDSQRIPLVAAVTDAANGRELLLGGLGLLALALASGSLLFLITRTGPQEAQL